MKQAHVLVSGFVQGVGFRFFVRDNAVKLGITGWVKNTNDGRVEMVFQADKKAIDQMIEICNKGPMLSEVKEIDVIWEESEKALDSFEIKPTE